MQLARSLKKNPREIAEDIKTTLVANGGNMEAAAMAYADSNLVSYEKTDAAVSVSNLDSGRAAKANELEKVGDISDVFVSKNGDGYYIVKLTAKAEGKVSYASIWIRFSKLADDLQKIRDEEKIKEYIKLEDLTEASEEEIETGEEAPTGE